MRDIVTVSFSISSAQYLTTPAFGKMLPGLPPPKFMPMLYSKKHI